MKYVSLIALVLAGCTEKSAPAGAATPDLAARVASAVRKAYPEAKVEVLGPDEVMVKLGELESSIGLDNMRLRCANGPEVCEESIAVAIKNLHLAELPKGKLDRTKILPTVKTSEFLSSVDKMMKEKLPEKFASNRLLRKPLVADLELVYVLDSETGMQMLAQHDLDENELTLEKVDALAKENLSAAFPALTPMEDVASGVFTNSKDENYASAMLVLPQLWAPLSKQVKAPLIVAVPARNRMFAISGKNKALPQFRKVVAAALEKEDHALSGALLEWTPKGFREWVP